jgi:hypothetical protein
MPSGPRSTWPLVLLLGLCVSLLLGSVAAVAAPSDGGQPWWHDGEPQHVTGTVVSVDPSDGTVVLDELFTYDPHRTGSIGSIAVTVAELGDLRAGETVDLDVVRHDGTWTAPDVTVLDTD